MQLLAASFTQHYVSSGAGESPRSLLRRFAACQRGKWRCKDAEV
jgi:hypothetical protein